MPETLQKIDRIVSPAFAGERSRRPKQSLDGNWELGLAQDCYEFQMQVPGAVWSVPELGALFPSNRQPNHCDKDVFLRRTFVSELGGGGDCEELDLIFEGIAPGAEIFLNGTSLGLYTHAVCSFRCRVGDLVRPAGGNELVVHLRSDLAAHAGGLVAMGSAIYGSVRLEKIGTMPLRNLFLRPECKTQSLAFSFEGACSGEAEVLSADRTIVAKVRFEQGSGRMEFPGFTAWEVENPYLYTFHAVSDGGDDVQMRFGMRSITMENGTILLNQKPLFLRGSSPEFMNSPYLIFAPDEIIRKKIRRMKEAGFNGSRLHTHIWPNSALAVADEEGFLLEAEIPLISNFHEIAGYPASLVDLAGKTVEVRNHPSIIFLSLGNESSQLMHDPAQRERAREAMTELTRLAPDHLCLTGCGYQGEYDDVPNAFQTPHFWSYDFTWAHQGLEMIPWRALEKFNGQCILHEYGKYTVWPDPEEDALFAQNHALVKGNYGAMAAAALRDVNLEKILPDVGVNARKLSAVCTKIALESARRQHNVQGYFYHAVEHVGYNKGFLDDFGTKIPDEFSRLAWSNADTAILIDRDYRGRSAAAESRQTMSFFLSHFGKESIADGTLLWSAGGGSQGMIPIPEFPAGRNRFVGKIVFRVPARPGKYRIAAKLVNAAGEVLARNEWEFWSVTRPNRSAGDDVLLDLNDFRFEEEVLELFPNLRRVDDFVSAWEGVVLGKGTVGTELAALQAGEIQTIVTDHWSELTEEFAKAGGFVVCIDRGAFPKQWYASPGAKAHHPDDKGAARFCREWHDVYRLYAPFRSGWDHGNAATVVADSPYLYGIEHEKFCDLQFFEMIDTAAPLATGALPGEEAEVILRLVPIARTEGEQSGLRPEDDDVERRWKSADWCYLAEKTLGAGAVVYAGCHLTASEPGRICLMNLIVPPNTNQGVLK
ncbi:MAG: glycoside hydrolase family 2 TIM barrel-domain containing protein [Victivallaceae bacterium]|nr:glycoside hydrolase family 2 TIM barrel-domain containing protein [Victivallaceae bacterium]